ncbi:MAG: coiled-coil protein [Candidatus Helarchaeota archaeon]
MNKFDFKHNRCLLNTSVIYIKEDCYDITVELVELQRKARIFEEKRDKFQAEAREWAKKRDYLNSKVGELLNQAQAEKKLRDKFNKKVKDLKKEKEAIKEKLDEYQKNANQIKKDLDSISSKDLKKIMKIRKQIKSLEWKYQTNVINTNEEKEIIGQIDRLEKTLEGNKDLLILLNQLEDQLNKIKEIQKELKKKQREIVNIAQKSQIHHQKMVDIYNEIDTKIRPEADKAHQKFLSCRKLADQNHENLSMLIPRIRILKKKLIQKRNDINKISEVVETRVKKALEKVKEGKRLTLEEFQLLVKSGLL